MGERKSIRLKGWDYSRNGYYFVTVDVQDKLKLFWDMAKIVGVDRCVDPKLNEIGKMIDYWWNEIPNHFDGVELDEYVVMPDHAHGIVKINDNGRTRGQTPTTAGRHRSARTTCVHALGDIIQWFKTMTTNVYIRGVKNDNWPKFHRRLWQRNYYERIIRNEIELNRVRDYIRNNPCHRRAGQRSVI